MLAVLDAKLPASHPLLAEGQFRGPAKQCHIKARNDIEAVAFWLREFDDSPNTLANYRKEVERLMLWAMSRSPALPLSSLTREDFADYRTFLADPQPAREWVGPPVARSNPAWRPFALHTVNVMVKGPDGAWHSKKVKHGGLADSSIRFTFDALRALYSYLHRAGYLTTNPIAARTRKQRGAGKNRRIERYLDRATFRFLIDFIEGLPQESQREQQHAARTRWLFYLLYLCRARRTEVAIAMMTHFYRDDVDGLWYWRILGKGEKERDVPVPDELLREFVRYRRFFGLPDYPRHNEDTPLVLSIAGSAGLTPKSIYLLVKKTCQRAAVALAATDPAKAEKLAMATTHWIRHTSATHFVDDTGDLRAAQETLGHASINTTMIYQHQEKTNLHKQSSRLKVRG